MEIKNLPLPTCKASCKSVSGAGANSVSLRSLTQQLGKKKSTA